MSEETSAKIGSIAARGVRDPASLTHDEIKEVCASALTQRPDHVVVPSDSAWQPQQDEDDGDSGVQQD